MLNRTAATADEYVDALPAERRATIAEMRKFIKKHLPKGYAEFVNFGMINYGIPLSRFADTGNGQPLSYVALAAQKNYYALYVMSLASGKERQTSLRKAFTVAGKTLDIGKSCIRFGSVDDLELPAIGKVIASISSKQWIAIFEAGRRRTK